MDFECIWTPDYTYPVESSAAAMSKKQAKNGLVVSSLFSIWWLLVGVITS